MNSMSSDEEVGVAPGPIAEARAESIARRSWLDEAVAIHGPIAGPTVGSTVATSASEIRRFGICIAWQHPSAPTHWPAVQEPREF